MAQVEEGWSSYRGLNFGGRDTEDYSVDLGVRQI